MRLPFVAQRRRSSSATTRAIRFSKPASRAFEYGRLSGRRRRAAALRARAAAREQRCERDRNDGDGATLKAARRHTACRPCVSLRQVLHRVDEAAAAVRVARVESPSDDRAGPAADAGQDRDVLLAVGPR
jgi:hypothetical protein